jgi:hypothetical protein
VRSGPRYDPAEVARLVREQQYWATDSVIGKLIDRNIDAVDKIEELLTSLATNGTFKKRLPLEDKDYPDTVADVYQVWSSEDEDHWYVKFFIMNGLLVVVLSCKYYGAPLW